MKSILISIQPQYVEKILNREKIYEIRRTIPKEWKEYLEGKTSIKPAPSKWYIYCTKGKSDKDSLVVNHSLPAIMPYNANGRVVAEFTLKNISYWQPYWTPEVMHICDISEKSCVSIEDLMKYCGDEIIYALHIEDLKIYDKPKELSEFSHYIPNNKCPKKECGIDCEDCMSYDGEHETCLALYYSHWQIKRPPQSWCYVNDLEGDAV